MRRLYLILMMATCLLSGSGCSKLPELSLEEQASAGIWFNQRIGEVLTIDKEQSAFIVQCVEWVQEKDKVPTFVYRVGKSSAAFYIIENNRFIFKEYFILYGAANEAYGYEEAWFDADGNLIIQMGRYFMSNDPSGITFKKDNRPNSTWEVVYTLKDPSFMINSIDIRSAS